MTDDDYREILKLIRQALDRDGLSRIDEHIRSFDRPKEGAFEDLIQYLRRLTDEIRSSRSQPIDSILERFNKYVRTESGAPVQGIRVETGEGEYAYYEPSRSDLRDRRMLWNLASTIEALIEELEEEHHYNQPGESD